MKRSCSRAVSCLLLLLFPAPWLSSAALAGDTILTNGSFEAEVSGDGVAPGGWFYFSSGEPGIDITDVQKRSGTRCLWLRTQEKAWATLGVAATLDVVPGTHYTFVAYVINDRERPLRGTAEGYLGIEWKDASGKEIGRVQGMSWTRHLSRLRWEPVQVTDKAPEEAATANFVIVLGDGSSAAEGACYVDDVQVDAK